MKLDPTLHNQSPDYVRELIAKAELNQTTSAQAIGIEPRTMRRYCSSRSIPYSVQFCLEWLAENKINQPDQD